MPDILVSPPGQAADNFGFAAHLHPNMLPPSIPGHGTLDFELSQEQKTAKAASKVTRTSKYLTSGLPSVSASSPGPVLGPSSTNRPSGCLPCHSI